MRLSNFENTRNAFYCKRERLALEENSLRKKLALGLFPPGAGSPKTGSPGGAAKRPRRSPARRGSWEKITPLGGDSQPLSAHSAAGACRVCNSSTTFVAC